MKPPSRSEMLHAFRMLFGRDPEAGYLDRLGESVLKAAWRLKALETHPDRARDGAERRQMSDRFIEARRAYGLLQSHLERRALHREHPVRPPRGSAAGGPPHRGKPRQAQARRAGAHQRTGILPRRRLRLGEYLYHSRVIPFSALIEAIVWQRRQRERFCEIGRRWGYLSEAEIRHLLEARRPHEPVGAAAQRLGLLSHLQVRTVLCHQRSRQERIGVYFVRRGLITASELLLLLRTFDLHNEPFPPPFGGR